MNTSNPSDIPVDAPPADRIAAAVKRWGEDEVVARSIALMAGRNAGDDVLLYVGGVHAQGILDGAPALYWPEVWGARALTFVWNDNAVTAITAGLTNQAWRVREMSLRVATLRKLDVADVVRPLLKDEVARVRSGAARALGELGDLSDTDPIGALFGDEEVEVRRAADQARKRLTARFPAAKE
ncbi:HEAT repeat domain-containing protein [Glaciihabitans sp. dw_435]|uniref:HEAT repeat domain-containing protein n=1 Tax=Glaciihabitans sp. dw_435 TaxID=2720081 RepID=UPI001BD4474A|nr:HEAT repeat domain-containing protein [Glaciihabitans sp. dw_435]